MGAQTIMLGAHLRELHNPKLHEQEERLVHGARRARVWGLGLVIFSGAVIALETLGAPQVLWAPAFVGKWMLLGAALGLELVLQQGWWRWAVEGVLGAVWYAVLIVHIAAPAASWPDLLLLFGLWAAAFYVLWTGTSAVMSGASPHWSVPRLRMSLPKFSLPKITLPNIKTKTPVFYFAFKKELPPAHKIAPESLPVVVAETLPVEMKVREYIEQGLPHVRVMPRTPEDVQRHFAHI